MRLTKLVMHLLTSQLSLQGSHLTSKLLSRLVGNVRLTLWVNDDWGVQRLQLQLELLSSLCLLLLAF